LAFIVAVCPKKDAIAKNQTARRNIANASTAE
jgi:hypothetical protein